ncbi:MAG: hypothetical protein SFU98_05035 [Leptospiraceae bacterium]|nr:hypothetical protein [Leptospiraceae bacterium]
MTSIAVELKLECRYCGRSIPVNAITHTLFCKECLSKIPVSKQSWKEFLGEICNRVINSKESRLTITGNIIPFYLEGNQAFRLYGKEEPKFKNHRITIPERIENPEGTEIEVFNTKIFIREVPKEYTSFLRGVRFLIGEDKNQIATKDTASEEIEKHTPVVFTCPSCGGSLKVDGRTRIIECEYCSSSVFLPDPLWLRFHPANLTRRLYLYYGNPFPSSV